MNELLKYSNISKSSARPVRLYRLYDVSFWCFSLSRSSSYHGNWLGFYKLIFRNGATSSRILDISDFTNIHLALMSSNLRICLKSISSINKLILSMFSADKFLQLICFRTFTVLLIANLATTNRWSLNGQSMTSVSSKGLHCVTVGQSMSMTFLLNLFFYKTW